MGKLRSKIVRIRRELDNIGQKAKIREDYFKATEVLKELALSQVLWQMVESEPITLRKMLGLIFEATNILVRTGRIPGSHNFLGDILDYKFTETLGALQSVQDDNRYFNPTARR